MYFNSESIVLGVFIGLFSSLISKYLIILIKNVLNKKFDISINITGFKYYIFGLMVSILLTMISSYFPSKKASNYDPINALKYE